MRATAARRARNVAQIRFDGYGPPGHWPDGHPDLSLALSLNLSLSLRGEWERESESERGIPIVLVLLEWRPRLRAGGRDGLRWERPGLLRDAGEGEKLRERARGGHA